MTIKNRVVPNIVGVDIGCGMYTVDFQEKGLLILKDWTKQHTLFRPERMCGDGRPERYDLTGLRCYRFLKDSKRLVRSLGTLGGGNHFIEVDEAKDGTKYTSDPFRKSKSRETGS